MKSTVVIYHRADFDGIFSREIARRFFTDAADYIGWDYNDPLPTIDPAVLRIYMIDISVDGLMDDSRLVWIDHHKSAIDKYSPSIVGFRIDGVAACRLAWQWFNGSGSPLLTSTHEPLPTKEDFVDRKVSEPLSVRLAGEYDIWDKRDPRAELFQHGLRSREIDDLWGLLLSPAEPSEPQKTAFAAFGREVGNETDGHTTSGLIAGLLAGGKVLQYAKAKENESIIRSNGFSVEFEGLCFLACNAARYNSHLFTAALAGNYDGLLGFNYDGKKWKVSMYGVPGKPEIDFSLIAAKYGGGGHKQACGFSAASLPFFKA